MNEDVIPASARAEIQRRLTSIEAQHGARVLFAVESGSRAWGFHSPDSDFDARFIYVRSPDSYLSLSAPRDVIETPIEGLFDVNGWDLAKALNLMIRGNSVVHEWLASPLVYRASPDFVKSLAPIALAWRSAYADTHHYYGLLSSQWARFIEGREQVNLKKYFYVVRPALALQWLQERSDPPPMDLPSLLHGVTLPRETADALATLQATKRASSEVGEGPRIAALDAYIEAQSAWAFKTKPQRPAVDESLMRETEGLFRAAVKGAFDES